MNTKTKSALPDVHSVVTNQFIEDLEKGIIPWHTWWTEHPVYINGWPVDHINVWLLANLCYPRNVFLNALQMTRFKTRKKERGEKGHTIVRIRHGNILPTLYCSEVYNIEQLEGLCGDEIPARRVISSPTKKCADLLAEMPKFPKIVWENSPAHYSLKTDTIVMPEEECFENVIQYYSSLFYGLAQSTAHGKRRKRDTAVDRKLTDPKTYSCEELITEMTASYLCSFTGITPWYLTTYHNDAHGWLRKLQTDTTLAITAAMYAQEAVNYILNRSKLANLIQTGVYVPEKQ
ncbi:hypothetical protein A3860_18510 [Niastella vici]|uniref:Polyvalent protein metallopeptidase domain-containing protein n=1 Tax=Niastella vici TaxID=1703345 RepID=A0A1V9G2F7_9BACT|nr:zincin-like metallopeptidase domain-containing protein [Niastella vici]OQP64752.1 hypothetical protein A3860_18510 [Niastella vici]